MSEAIIFVPLTRGKVAVIDFDDRWVLDGRKWCAAKRSNTWYAVARRRVGNAGRKRGVRRPDENVFLHNLIAGSKGVDHWSGDGLDNRRDNLRICTQTNNNQNRRKTTKKTHSRFKGVCIDVRDGRIFAYIDVNKKRSYLGGFPSEEDAAKAYDQAAVKHFGPFARTNAMMGLFSDPQCPQPQPTTTTTK